MRRVVFLAIALGLMPLAAAAQDQGAGVNIGPDRFMAGDAVVHDTAGVDDLFMAGDRHRVAADITGSAHIAGREITIDAEVGGDAYIAGMNIDIAGPVAGDANLAGYSIMLDAPLGGDLRAAAARVTVAAPVAGYAAMTGDAISIDAAIAGDVEMTARTVDFGPGARIGGHLTLYEEDPDTVTIPERVVSADRVTRLKAQDAAGHDRPDFVPKVIDWRSALLTFVKGVIIVALAAAAIAAVAPGPLATLRRRLLAHPFRSIWIGFLAQSVVIGAAFLLVLTIVGILVAPLAVLLALVGGFLGYVVAAYAIGVGLMLAIGRPEPDTLGQRALSAAVGALVAAVIALVPWVGWIFVLMAVLAGLGALTQQVFRPGFFTDAGPGHTA